MLKRLAICSTILLFFAAPASAQQSGLFSTTSLTPDIAVKAAQAALQSCRNNGYQVAVAIVDRGGNMQVMIRDQLAGPHTPDTAYRKAWTAVSFRTPTADLAVAVKNGSTPAQITHISNALLVGGGVMFESKGTVIGAIGVSGAPPGTSEGDSIDGRCAQAGIDAISDILEGF